MNIQINSQGYNANQAASISNAGELVESRLLNAGKQLSLAVGDILSGRVAEMKDGNILLILDNGQGISAKLSGNMDIEVGRSLSFEVKSNADNQTELRPLYTNLAMESTAHTALSEASIPATDRNVSMVMSMMEEGMAVNKQALLDMVSVLNSNPKTNVETLVQMQKLGLSIDENTIHQFENYKNFEHKIVGDVLNMSDGLSNIFSEMSVTDEDSAFDKLSQVLELVAPEEGEENILNTVKNDTSEIDKLIKDFTELLNNEGNDNEPVNESGILDKARTLVKAYINNPQSFSPEIKENIKELLNKPEFKDVLKENIIKQLTLKPEDVKEEGRVENLYKRILEFSSKSLDILNNSSTNTEAAKSAQNLMDNVQFMNQLNEMMTYIQLPLKLGKENAHGDLYVYTNKKKLAENDGNFSALLHLDMEHLGPMDVYVAMQMEKVSTHFYMQDEATLDFIEANIHLLDERLAKKGYKMNTTVSVIEETKSMVDTFLEDKNNGTISKSLSTLSFDVRA